MDGNLQTEINGRVLELLKLQGKNREWLSLEAEIDKAQLSEILNCKNNKRWDSNKIERVARALDVPSWQLLVDPKIVIDDTDREIISRYHALPDNLKNAVDAILFGEGEK